MKVTYCQVGAGKLGLGLAYPLFAPQAHRSILLQRPSPSRNVESSTRNRLLEDAGHFSVDNGPTVSDYPVGEFVLLDDQSRGRALEAFMAADVITIVTGKRTENCWELLVEADRRKTQPCALLVFDNASRSSTSLLDSISTKMGHEFENLIPCDVVCDRICTGLELEDRRVVVHTEEFSDVTVRVPTGFQGVPAILLSEASGVRLVSDDRLFDAYERRKAWLVNAAHYAFAALGLKRNALYTVDMAARDRQITKHVEHMQGELALALLLWMAENGVEPDHNLQLPELLVYAQTVRERVAAGPSDEIGRIFKPLLEYSEHGSMHSDLVEYVKEKNESLLFEHLENIVERKEYEGVNMTARDLIKDWQNQTEIRRYRQELASEIAIFVARLIRRIGLSSFFEKARARLHEPLGIILKALTEAESAGRYPLYTSEAMLAVQEAVQFYVLRAEQDAGGGG